MIAKIGAVVFCVLLSGCAVPLPTQPSPAPVPQPAPNPNTVIRRYAPICPAEYREFLPYCDLKLP